MLTAFKTSKRTLAVWYALVSCALKEEKNYHHSSYNCQWTYQTKNYLGNQPVSFISSILQSLDIFFVVMLIKTLHLTSITLLYPSLQSWIIFLAIMEQKIKYTNLAWNYLNYFQEPCPSNVIKRRHTTDSIKHRILLEATWTIYIPYSSKEHALYVQE